jgi:hypothetical protein
MIDMIINIIKLIDVVLPQNGSFEDDFFFLFQVPIRYIDIYPTYHQHCCSRVPTQKAQHP